ncbi:30S ribosomal protein S17 [Alphaproteobacteria bacterium]|nr:30S ribosomal protein S17 [Alphaproteobacteria bacterium]
MPRRVLQGVVVSDKNDKTIMVKVENKLMHPIYKKYVKRHKKYATHDEQNACKIGDIVSIIESRPNSKTKKWVLMDEKNGGGNDSI